jgi:quercetin dioxygenase-like cupin family protein
MGRAQDLADLVEYSNDSIVSKTLLSKRAGTLTLFAFDAGQGLSEHTSPYDAVVQVIDGRAAVTIGGEETEVLAGQIIVMPADVPHSVVAKDRFKMVLTMIRG